MKISFYLICFLLLMVQFKAYSCNENFEIIPIKKSYLLPKQSKKFDLTNNPVVITDSNKEIILLNDYQYSRLPVGSVLSDKQGKEVIKKDIKKIEQEGFIELGIDKQYYDSHLLDRELRQFSDSRVIGSWNGVDIEKSETREGRQQIVEYLESLEKTTWIWFDTETTGLSTENSQLTEIYAAAGKLKFERSKAQAIFHQNKEKHLKIKLSNHSVQTIVRDITNPPENLEFKTLREILVMQNYPFVAQDKVLSKKSITRSEWDSSWDALLKSQKTLIEEEKAVSELFQLFQENEMTVQVAHNLPFDMNMVNSRALVSQNKYYLGQDGHSMIDTELLIKKYWIPLHQQKAAAGDVSSAEILAKLTVEGKRGPYISASMGTVTKAMGIVNDGWHQADVDVKMMIKVFCRVYTDLVQSL